MSRVFITVLALLLALSLHPFPAVFAEGEAAVEDLSPNQVEQSQSPAYDDTTSNQGDTTNNQKEEIYEEESTQPQTESNEAGRLEDQDSSRLSDEGNQNPEENGSVVYSVEMSGDASLEQADTYQERGAQTESGQQELNSETQTDGGLLGQHFPVRLKLNLPTDLSGLTIYHTDMEGQILSESFVDASGKGEIEVDPDAAESVLTINSEEIKPAGKAYTESTYTRDDLIATAAVVGAILFGVGFWLGRRSGVRLLDSLREYIYEEDLD